MRSLPLTRVLTLAAILASVCLPAPSAQAAPVRNPFPKKAGKLATTSCPETPIVSGGIPRTREYLQTVVKCLDKSWGAYVERAGRTFRKPVVRYFEEPADTVCGMRWPAYADAFYCTERATVVFPLTGRWLENRTDLYPFKVAAHEYGHHLQSLLGIRRSFEVRARADRTHQDQLKRRYELQADCLSGVFLGSVWRSLARSEADWAALLDATRASGDDDGHRTHGKGASRVHWLKRGYGAVSPAACDTWSAPATRVA
ncbi:metalloprotease-like protein [Nonomuraea deserti]|uniref:Metalloprotease-like protein n=1 Tax=Nonomuraea deserti TaxID=1848322 RepID=A0A4R4V800_9ACTN|nr:neutral zinc metallopeptidase [Nonomuraea deserti]TDD01398.1 metalloprotease-like protein [Nonomuraea deserti]